MKNFKMVLLTVSIMLVGIIRIHCPAIIAGPDGTAETVDGVYSYPVWMFGGLTSNDPIRISTNFYPTLETVEGKLARHDIYQIGW